MKESAALLGLAYNSVEAHLARARRHNHCRTTFQLLALWAHNDVPFAVPTSAPDPMAAWQQSYRRRYQNEMQQIHDGTWQPNLND